MRITHSRVTDRPINMPVARILNMQTDVSTSTGMLLPPSLRPSKDQADSYGCAHQGDKGVGESRAAQVPAS